MTKSEIKNFRELSYRQKHDNYEDVATWILCKVIDVLLKEGPKRAIQYTQSGMLLLGEDPPASVVEPTEKDFWNYWGVFAKWFRGYDVRKWTKDHSKND